MNQLKALVEKRDRKFAQLQELEASLQVEGEDEPRALTEDEETRSRKLIRQVDDLEKEIVKETKRERRQRFLAEARTMVANDGSDGDGGSTAAVTDEGMQYGLHSKGDHSYFDDFVRYTMGPLVGSFDPAVGTRMATWAHQIEREVHLGTERGRYAIKQIRGLEGIRQENGMHARKVVEEVRARGAAAFEAKAGEFRSGLPNAELRAGITTGGGATASAAGGGAAAFVIPVFYENQYAPFRHPGRVFTDMCNARPLPDYGMTVYLPAVQSAAGIGQQTEGQGITETDPSAGFLSGGLITTAGQVTITQQLLDRAGPNVSFDQILFDQLVRAYNPNFDTYVLQQALANAGAVTFTAGAWKFIDQPGNPSYVSKFAGAINQIETTAGTIMSPNAAFMVPARWNFIESVGALESTSGTLHPLVVPNPNGPFNAVVAGSPDGKVPYEGDTGYKLLGLPLLKDLNIPTPGTGADQSIVANTQEVYVYEGPLVPRVIPQTLAPNLAVLLQLYTYGAVIVRYPSAVQKISGTGMAAITF